MRRSVLASLLTTAAIVTSTVVLASPAAADPVPCPWEPTGKCAYVLADALNVRTGPGSGYPIVVTLPRNQLVEVFCWTTGTYVNGYNIWTRLDTVDNSPEYVSDYYLSTGHVQSFIQHC